MSLAVQVRIGVIYETDDKQLANHLFVDLILLFLKIWLGTEKNSLIQIIMNIVTAEPNLITFVTGQAAVAFVISNVTSISESL